MGNLQLSDGEANGEHLHSYLEGGRDRRDQTASQGAERVSERNGRGEAGAGKGAELGFGGGSADFDNFEGGDFYDPDFHSAFEAFSTEGPAGGNGAGSEAPEAARGREGPTRQQFDRAVEKLREVVEKEVEGREAAVSAAVLGVPLHGVQQLSENVRSASASAGEMQRLSALASEDVGKTRAKRKKDWLERSTGSRERSSRKREEEGDGGTREEEVQSPLKRARRAPPPEPLVRVSVRPGKRGIGAVLGQKLRENEMEDARKRGKLVGVEELTGARRNGPDGTFEYEVVLQGSRERGWMGGGDLLGTSLAQWKRQVDRRVERELGNGGIGKTDAAEARPTSVRSANTETGRASQDGLSKYDSEATDSVTASLGSGKGMPRVPAESAESSMENVPVDLTDQVISPVRKGGRRVDTEAEVVTTIRVGAEKEEVTHRNLLQLRYR